MVLPVLPIGSVVVEPGRRDGLPGLMPSRKQLHVPPAIAERSSRMNKREREDGERLAPVLADGGDVRPRQRLQVAGHACGRP